MSERAARRILRPYVHLLSDCAHHAWEGWQRLGAAAPDLRADARRGSRAFLVNDWMSAEAGRRFEPLRGVDVVHEFSQVILVFASGDLRVTLHKMDPGTTPDPDSDRQISMWEQEDARKDRLATPISGTWARCGYVLDNNASSIESVIIQCSTFGEPNWEIALPTPRRLLAATPVTLAMATRSGPPAPRLRSAASFDQAREPGR